MIIVAVVIIFVIIIIGKHKSACACFGAVYGSI